MLTRKIVRFFDKLEDKIRGRLSHHPIFYALVGGIGVVLFWRGVWHTADDVGLGSIASLVAGSVILLLIGVFVSAFVGNRLIISGLIRQKKLEEKQQGEIETEASQIKSMQNTLSKLEKKLQHLDEEVEKN